MKTRLLYIPLLMIAFGVALGDPQSMSDDWSPVVYPEQRIPLRFSHAKHAKLGVQCAACHPAATTSRSAVDNLLPTEAECRTCHPIDRKDPERVVAGAPTAKCIACHPGFSPEKPVERVYIATPPLKFAH